MKITFIVPELNLTGGLRVVSIYAEILAKKGHQLTVVSPNEKTITTKERIKAGLKWQGYKFKSGFDRSFFNEVNYDLKVLNKYRAVIAEDVPDADIIIATFWSTAEWIAAFPESKGKKVYFIQHYEIHPWLPVERVKATLRLPFKKIVVAQWIAKILIDDYQQEDISVIGNAVDHKLFDAPTRAKNTQITFGMMYSDRVYKGSQWAMQCFQQLHQTFPSIRLVAFGLEPIEAVMGLPEGTEYYSQPAQDKIREIYSQCDAWLFTSQVEGFGLPILEAMACRTPVIGTRCGAAPDLLSSGGGMIITCENNDELLSAMTRLYDMEPDIWLKMSNEAYNEGRLHRWEEKANQIEQVITAL